MSAEDQKPERNSTGCLKVEKIHQETPTVRTFRLVNPIGGKIPFKFKPGQYLTLHFSIEGEVVDRPYTIASSPSNNDFIEISAKREQEGKVSSYLHDKIVAGDTFEFTGPAGSFTFDGSNARQIVLITGGAGITTASPKWRYLHQQNWDGNVVFIGSFRDQSEIIYRDEIESLIASYDSFDCVITLTREPEQSDWQGERGRINKKFIAKHIKNLKECCYHICGPWAMIEEVIDALQGLGVSAKQIHTESYAPKPTPDPV